MRRYSFQDTVMILNGVEIVGWADGDDVLEIKRREDSLSDVIGAAGDMMVSIGADRSGSITFKLQQTSPSNQYLNALMELQEAAGSIFVPVFARFQDTYRQDYASGTSGYITKPADMTRGTKGQTQEWVVVVESLQLAFGNVD